MPKTDANAIAEFMTKRGVTRVAEGASTLGYTRRDWQAAVRGETPPSTARAQHDQDREDARIQVVTDHLGREFYRNAKGEWL